jgi:hypothetical protein
MRRIGNDLSSITTDTGKGPRLSQHRMVRRTPPLTAKHIGDSQQLPVREGGGCADAAFVYWPAHADSGFPHCVLRNAGQGGCSAILDRADGDAVPNAKGYGYYCWINHAVETEPEFGAMGFKGQFITVLPKENAVVVMTSILPTDGGLRDATYLNRLCQFSRQQSMGNVAARGIAVRRLRGSRGQ